MGKRLDIRRSQAESCPSLMEIYIRSLSLQASWNPKRMQNLGLVFSLLPWLRCQRKSRKQIRQFCRRHLVYFNTNPYLGNFLVGGLLKLERDTDSADGRGYERIETYKSTLGRALASLGDQLFWLGLQPSLMLVAGLIALSGAPIAALLLVGLFAVGELVLRFLLLKKGYELGMDIVDLLGSPNWHRAVRLCGRAGSIAAGALLAVLVLPGPGPLRIDSWQIAALGCIVCAAMLLRRRLPGESIVVLLLPVALLLAVIQSLN